MARAVYVARHAGSENSEVQVDFTTYLARIIKLVSATIAIIIS
jgi:hypothetical protein